MSAAVDMAAGCSARDELAAALPQRAVLLEPVHDPVQRGWIHAELAADLAHGNTRARFDHLEQLVAAAVATGARGCCGGGGSGGARRGRRRLWPCAPRGAPGSRPAR